MNRRRILALLALTAACQPARTTTPAAPAPCSVDTDSADVNVSVHAAVRLQPATLLQLDCTGALRPGLAREWSDSAGIVWYFTLDDVVAAHEVMPALSAAPLAHAVTRLGALSGNVLRLELRDPARPHLFAHPGFALAPHRPGNVTVHDGAVAEALDAGVDVVITADAALLDYARARGDYTARALPWSRTLVIAASGPRSEHSLPAEVAQALARDVVRGSARPFDGDRWWDRDECVMRGASFRSRAEARDIVYPRGDAVAQALAERIVALSWPRDAVPAWLAGILPQLYGTAGAPRLVALDSAALLSAIRTRAPLAVVVPLPHLHDALCIAGSTAAASSLIAAGWQLTPMLETRDVLLHRSGVGRFVYDAWGAIRFESR